MSGNTSASDGYLTPTSIPPADDDALGTILHDFICGLTGLAPTLVFPRWQPQPPTMPPLVVNWAAIGITTYTPVGYWPEMVQNDDGSATQKQHQKLDLIGTFYGPGSSALAAVFHDGLTVRQNLEVLGTFGIKLEHVGAISHVPELVNTQYVSRSDVEFRLVREIDRTYNILTVTSATVQLTGDAGYSGAVVVTPSTIPYL